MTEKLCYKCGITKPLDGFHKNVRRPDGRANYCKDCAKVRNREYYLATPERNGQRRASSDRLREKAREFIWNYLSAHPCVDCGVSDPRVLEFDHVRGEKSYDISAMVRRSMGVASIEAEVEKCEVRCANCHRIITFERAGSWRAVR